jgi:hypothetical protein
MRIDLSCVDILLFEMHTSSQEILRNPSLFFQENMSHISMTIKASTSLACHLNTWEQCLYTFFLFLIFNNYYGKG